MHTVHSNNWESMTHPDKKVGLLPAYLHNPLKGYPSSDSSAIDSGRSSPVHDLREDEPETSETLDDQLLRSAWKLSYREKAQKGKEWTNESQDIATIDTIMNFWQVFNHISQPTRIRKRNNPNLMFFREGIEPTWEDEQNKDGGMWGIVMKTGQRYNPNFERDDRLNGYWMEAVLACIGESLPHSEYINGIVLQRRQREDRIQIWTRDAENTEVQISIGKHMKHLMNIGSDLEIQYTVHADMANITARNTSWSRQRSTGRNDYSLNDSGSEITSPTVITPTKDISYGRMLESIDRLKLK